MDQVLDEPNMLEWILEKLDPKDIVHLYLSGNVGSRFQDTIQYVLSERKEAHACLKVQNFCAELCSFLDLIRKEPTQLRLVDDMFEFLMDNVWYKDSPDLQAFDATVERKLIQFATGDVYSHNALNYLSLLFGIDIRWRIEDEDLVEYIVDSQGNVHDL